MTDFRLLLVLVCLTVGKCNGQSTIQEKYRGVALPIHRIPKPLAPPRHIKQLESLPTNAPTATSDEDNSSHRQFHLQRNGYPGSSIMADDNLLPRPINEQSQLSIVQLKATTSEPSPLSGSRHFFLPRPIPRPIPRPNPQPASVPITHAPDVFGLPESQTDKATTTTLTLPEIKEESSDLSVMLPKDTTSNPMPEDQDPEITAIKENQKVMESMSAHPAPLPPTTASSLLKSINSPSNSELQGMSRLPPRPVPRPMYARYATTHFPLLKSGSPSEVIEEQKVEETPSSIAPADIVPAEIISAQALELSSTLPTTVPVTYEPLKNQDSSTVPPSSQPEQKPPTSVASLQTPRPFNFFSGNQRSIMSAPPRYGQIAPPKSSPKPVKPKPMESDKLKSVSIINDMICDLGDNYYAAKDECEAFIECKKNEAIKYQCPDGLYFNPEVKWPNYPCAYPSEVQCVSEIKHTPVSSGLCPRQYGFFPSGEDCSQYLMCQGGRAIVMTCPVGLAFNSITESCDWPANVPSCNPEVFKGFACPPASLDETGNTSDIILNYKYGNRCKEYVACQRGHPRLLSCDGDYSFDEELGYCAPSDQVICDVF